MLNNYYLDRFFWVPILHGWYQNMSGFAAANVCCINVILAVFIQYHGFHHTLGSSFHCLFYFPFVYLLMNGVPWWPCMEFPCISSLTFPHWSLVRVLTYSLPRMKWVIARCHFIFNKVSKVYQCWFS